jgi:uncharacterized repeat protein (TIGR03803 family)
MSGKSSAVTNGILGSPSVTVLQFEKQRTKVRNSNPSSLRAARVSCAVFLAIAPGLVITTPANAQSFGVLYSFTGGSDGSFPAAPLLRDALGNLYGTTSSMVPPPGFEGNTTCLIRPGSCGAVFKLDRKGAETTLYSFRGMPDGAQPVAGLVSDPADNLYGTTQQGGDTSCNIQAGCGTVFKIAPDGAESVVYDFTGGEDGSSPVAGLTRDAAGNLYGTTYFGGDLSCEDGIGCGTVFRLSASGVQTVLHRFGGGTDGELPAAGLVRDGSGNLYGTTLLGGAYGSGTVFEVSRAGIERVLYSFTGGGDGSLPLATLVRDGAGNLYGTTQLGGAYGGGTTFELDASGREHVLHSFGAGLDGANPFAGLATDGAGNLYGTTFFGGGTFCESGCGTVFELTANGSEKILHRFTGRMDGGYPRAALVRDTAGNLYGTAEIGGASGAGVVFELNPDLPQ